VAIIATMREKILDSKGEVHVGSWLGVDWGKKNNSHAEFDPGVRLKDQ